MTLNMFIYRSVLSAVSRNRGRSWNVLPVDTEVHLYIKMLNYITNIPTCFSASAQSTGKFEIGFAKVIKHENY
jgi:hypothetical protein